MAHQTRTKAGIREIAAASGVSQATVSQVLGNGKRPVRRDTRERIEQIARELGYRPNALARGLAKNRINTLGVVIHHDLQAAHTNPTLNAILDGILAAATRHQQHTNIVTYACWADAESSLPTDASRVATEDDSYRRPGEVIGCRPCQDFAERTDQEHQKSGLQGRRTTALPIALRPSAAWPF